MSQLILPPGYRRPENLFILCFEEPRNGNPPKYFLTHPANYEKMKSKSFIRIIGRIEGRPKAQKICHELNQNIKNSNYKPPSTIIQP